MSKKQPFCDGSHHDTDFKPLKFSLDEKLPRVYMCGCKLTSTAPFCDGETCKKLAMGEKIYAKPKDEPEAAEVEEPHTAEVPPQEQKSEDKQMWFI